MNKTLLLHLEAALGQHFTKTETVAGGDINKAYLLHGHDKKLFVKVNTDDNADMFEKEFAGLELLRNANAITVPQPIIHGKSGSDIYLVMEFLDKGTITGDFWRTFARQLASLHRDTNKKFGLDRDNYIGSLPQSNKQCNTWAEFYAEQRIQFLTRMAFDAKKCDRSDIKMAEKVCSKLDELFPNEQPSLLHGDLWSGNYLINKDNLPAVYDPAVYYGHREMDIGMTLLFGGFDRVFYSYYNEAWPLEKHWEERVDLTQLYPLLVHLNLFGGHYYTSVREILKRYS